MSNFIEWIQSWTMDGKLAILLFPVLLALLLWASLKMVKFSEVIIAKSRFGGGFVGGVLIAATTSMPELITEVVQGLANHPENGIGDDIGSNAFSIFLIGVAGIVTTRKMFLNTLSKWTKTSILISFGATVAMTLALVLNRDIAGGAIGIIPLTFFLFYLFTLYLTWKYDKGDESNTPQYVKHITLKEGVIKFFIFSLILIGFAVLVNVDVNAFQDGIGIPSESAGGVFLAITTSAPEVVAFMVFLQKGQPTAAIGSLIGSHFFNLGISFFGDLAYTEGATFNNDAVGNHWALAALTSIMLLFLVTHITFSKKFPKVFHTKRIYLISPIVISLTYIVGWILILAI